MSSEDVKFGYSDKNYAVKTHSHPHLLTTTHSFLATNHQPLTTNHS